MRRTYITLNISASGIKLLSVKGREVEKWTSMPLAPGLVRDGLITQPKVVGAVISALFESAGVSKERVIISLTGLPFTYRILSLPRMKSTSLHEAIRRAAQREMQLPLEDLYLSWQTIDERRDEQDFFVLGVPRNIVDAVAETLAEAGVKPYVMDIKPLALARAANRGDAIIMDLEPGYFDITLVVNGILSVMHTVIPRGEGSLVEDNIRRLTDELSKTVEFYNASHPQNPLSPTTPLLLTGELSTDVITCELIQAATEYPVEPLVPPFNLPPDLPVALFAANIGLALKKSPLKKVQKGNTDFFRDIDLNIIPDKDGHRDVRVKLSNIILTVALLISIGLLQPVYQLRSHAAAGTIHLQTELTRIQQELDKQLLATEKAKQLENNIDKIAARAERMEEEHQNILNKGREFADILQLATNALPDEAYFTSVKIGSDQITVGGEADNAFTVVSYVIALEELEKFSDVRIAWINESKSTGDGTTEIEILRVSFNIIISK